MLEYIIGYLVVVIVTTDVLFKLDLGVKLQKSKPLKFCVLFLVSLFWPIFFLQCAIQKLLTE